MAKISLLPVANLPLDGSETGLVVQDGVVKQLPNSALISPLLDLLTPHPVDTHFGVAAPAAGAVYAGFHAALAKAVPAGIVEILGLDLYIQSGENIRVTVATATNVVDGFLTDTSVLTLGAQVGPFATGAAGLYTVSPAQLAPLGDLTGKFLVIFSGVGTHIVGTVPAGDSQWVRINGGTLAATLMTTSQFQMKLRYRSGYTYTLDYDRTDILDLIANTPSVNAQLLATAARLYGFFPQPSGRAAAGNVPVLALGAAGANSAINGRAPVSPLVLANDSRIQWLNGPLSTDGSGSWKPRGAWYGGSRNSQFAALEFVHTGSDFELAFSASAYDATDNVRILVDGQTVALATVPSNTGNLHYLRCTFPGPAERRVRIETAGLKMRGINVAASGELTGTQRSYPLISVLGDSFAEGTGGKAIDGEAVALVRALGGDIMLGAVGGTGMLNPGTGGKVAWTDATRLTDLTMAGVVDALGRSTAPAMGIVMASINDQGAPQAWWNGASSYQEAVTKATFTIIDAWIAANPGKPLVFFGPTWTTGNPVLDIYRMRDGIQTAVWGAADRNVHFIDRLGPTPLLREGARSFTSTTGETANGSAVVTGIASTAGVIAGSSIEGAGIPPGATVVSIGAGTVTMNVAATVSAAGVALTFRNDHAALYAFGPADGTHPGAEGHSFDALWMAAQLRRIVNDLT